MERKSKKSPYRFIVWFLILIALLFFLGKAVLFYFTSPVSSDSTNQSFTIQNGEGTMNIAEKLVEAHLIRSSLIFELELKLMSKTSDLQAGEFTLSPSMSMDEIIQRLGQGTDQKQVTLIEGWRDEEMADRLHQTLGINQSDFLSQAKQGYMFPDTYKFNKDVSTSDVVAMLRRQFDTEYTDSLKNKVLMNGLTLDQGVILASIVEREGRSDQVRTEIASILLKRLRIGMKLQADATVQYALGYQSDEKSWWKKDLSLDDLQVDSPYNTYVITGLPPAPICNPSSNSLQAVANADPSTQYLFYYIDPQGNVHYAKTLEEHNQNIAQYR